MVTAPSAGVTPSVRCHCASPDRATPVRDISGQVGLRTAPMVIERLRLASGARTDRELASFLNVSAAAISNARKSGRIPPDWVIDTGLRTGRSIDWLVCGTPAPPC